MDYKMFCYQCQETAGGKGCTIRGVCGKEPTTSGLMDLLISALRGIAIVNRELRRTGAPVREASRLICDSLFATITNANFDNDALSEFIRKAFDMKDFVCGTAKKREIPLPEMPEVEFKAKPEDWEKYQPITSVLAEPNADLRGLKQLAIFGCKGMSAYADHARNLGHEDEDVYAIIENALAEISRADISADELVSLDLNVGDGGVKVMDLLDRANTGTYGNPEITKVEIGVRKNPGILITGHDLHDLEMLLEQTKGTGVDVYTHSEMLPAHYYPFFKKYPHFAGNYGNVWWKQKEEFATFNGPILFTTNCLVPPTKDAVYADKVYTTGVVGYPGFPHIPTKDDGTKDFSIVIEHAKKCQAPTQIESGEIIGGFAHHQVAELADKVVEAVKSGAIRKFVVMAGCDGRFPSRKYYTEFAEKLPKDIVILTAGCAKYRYNKLPLGDINGIPRVLDAGQCNDSYSLVRIALMLAKAFGVKSVNDLPIAYNIAWYEQKAVIVLLALLSLGVQNIHTGPTLPAFFTPDILKVLQEKFHIATITNVDDDIKLLIG